MDGIDKLIDSVKRIIRKETEAYDTAATVRRIEGKTAWVHIDGGVDETPVKLTINAQPGDSVQVRVSGGKAFLVGNGSAPPTDDRVANYARSIATTAQTTAEDAQEAAEAVTGIATAASANASAAITLAEGIDDHFWSDSAGAHITEDTQEDYLADPSAAGGNTLITSAGMAVRHGTTQLAAFTSTGAQIGQNANGQTRSVIGTSGMSITQKNSGGTDVTIANLGYGPGTDSGGGTSDAPYYTLGFRKSGSGIGNYSTAEGYETEASGFASHAEGYLSTASNVFSHSEGQWTIASGAISHAEGLYTTASGDYSHAEGRSAHATGDCSHAQNDNTTAGYNAQTAIGKYNDNKSGTAFEIGNGSAGSPSNALTVDWSGNVDIASGAKYKINGTALAAADVSALPIAAIDAGTTGQITVSANSYVSKDVTFNKTFSSAPLVVCGFATGATAAGFGRCSCSVTGITTAGCTIRVYNSDSSQRGPTVYWIAIKL